MARLILALPIALAALLLSNCAAKDPAPPAPSVSEPKPAENVAPSHDDLLKGAGVCSRCHVVQVLEWGISKHVEARTHCRRCHGASSGHVANERNEVKPDRVPHGQEIAPLCGKCHEDGCPETRAAAGCEGCHHVHALIDVAKWKAADAELPALTARGVEPAGRSQEGENRSRATPPGFELDGEERDAATGLPRRVKVAGLGIAMRLVSPGEFDMGDDEIMDSRPVHAVRVEAFYLGVHEVTQVEWQAVMGSNPSAHQGAEFPDSALLPVESISWDDCRAFIARLNERVPGGGFRLPSEAEWEYACRAGVMDMPDETLPLRAWYRANSRRASGVSSNDAELPQVEDYSPRPAGTKAPNVWGFHDLEGNVSEWCASAYEPYLASESQAKAAPAPPLRVVRGGSYADLAESLRPGARHGERPERRLRWNGLRVARGVGGE